MEKIEKMKENSRSFVTFLSVLIGITSHATAENGYLGVFPSATPAQTTHESVFLGAPAPNNIDKYLRALTEEPHVAGTEAGNRVAEYVNDRFKSFGLDSKLVEYEVFLNYPSHVSLTLLEPVYEELSLRERPIDSDKDSTAHGMYPGFHGYGASGYAIGQVVYANYGTPADYKKLESMGVSVEGKIVIARYGTVFRGLKVKEAEDRGALGVIIYSDPADDGYMKGDVYPEGPMRPASAIQRGSVQFLSLQPGDPSTPGYPSLKGADRLTREEMNNVPNIPSLPISYEEAEKILWRLGGQNVPEEWQGGLPFAYHIGPGGAVVELQVAMEDGLRSIYNVIATIEGSEEKDSVIVLGNHHDAWNHGAVDPSSGTAALVETARALSEALKNGWKPRRTIILAAWDAEEYGLVGSVEWGEDQAGTLRENGVAYLNVDSAATGADLSISGVPSLRDLMREAAQAVDEPKAGGTLGDVWEKRLKSSWASSSPVDLDNPDEDFNLQLGALGSGSDYTVFLDHLGVPSADIRFRGGYGVYHSVYDNYKWLADHGDPGFLYHAAVSKFWGLLAMRLASADVIPFTFTPYADTLNGYADDLQREVIRKRRTPSEEAENPPLNPDFTTLREALADFNDAARAADETLAKIVSSEDQNAANRANDLIVQVERGFLTEKGLPPDRPWFKHVIYAPGTTTGYAAWPYPGLRQALEVKDSELFDREEQKLLNAIRETTRRLQAVAALR